MRIDLHTHSILSDGSDTVTELVAQAKAAELDVVALTDHDIVDGWAEALTAGERFGVRVVCGTEWSTTNEGRGQHLLAYGFEPTDPAIIEELNLAASSRADRAEGVRRRLDELDKPIDRAYLESLLDGGVPSRKHIAAALTKAGHVASDDEAFAALLNPGAPATAPEASRCRTNASERSPRPG